MNNFLPSNRDNFASIQKLVQREARLAAEAVFDEKIGKIEFSNFKTPKHIHNGVDAPRINAQDIVRGFAASGSITMATDGTRYDLGLSNARGPYGFKPTQMMFYGNVIRRNATFTVTAASATDGDIYSTGGKQFEVLTTIAGGTTLSTAGNGTGLTSGTLTKVSGSGDATITFSAVSTSIVIRAFVFGNAFIGPSYYFQPQDADSVKVGGNGEVVTQSCSSLLIDSSIDPPVVRALASEGHLISVEYPAGTVIARGTIPDLGQFGADAEPLQNGAILVDVTLSPGWEINGNFFVL